MSRELPPLHQGARVVADGPHGPIVDGYQDRLAEAVEWLSRAQTGDFCGVLAHPDVPARIDVIWGDKDYGLLHIIENHEEVVGNFPERLARMRVYYASENRIRLTDNVNYAVVRLGWESTRKVWLLTAFEAPARRRDDGEPLR